MVALRARRALRAPFSPRAAPRGAAGGREMHALQAGADAGARGARSSAADERVPVATSAEPPLAWVWGVAAGAARLVAGAGTLFPGRWQSSGEASVAFIEACGAQARAPRSLSRPLQQ